MSEVIVNLINTAAESRRNNRLADAHRDLTEAVKLCRSAGAQPELVRALKGLGQIQRDKGRVDAALPLYEEAVSICRKYCDDLMLAHTVRHLGDIHRALGDVELAESNYQEALVLYRGNESTSPLDLANAIRPLAILWHDAGEIEEATSLWTEAKDLYVKADVKAGVNECENRLAELGRRRREQSRTDG
jgi:tetratricopeptide (TPR) repeat protein